jgi:hypothetical protein
MLLESRALQRQPLGTCLRQKTRAPVIFRKTLRLVCFDAWLNARTHLCSFHSSFPTLDTMDPLPPNDPNNNMPAGAPKEAPYDGRPATRREQTDANARMDMVGDLRDSPVVVAMFLVGVVSWFLRERGICIC